MAAGDNTRPPTVDEARALRRAQTQAVQNRFNEQAAANAPGSNFVSTGGGGASDFQDLIQLASSNPVVAAALLQARVGQSGRAQTGSRDSVATAQALAGPAQAQAQQSQNLQNQAQQAQVGQLQAQAALARQQAARPIGGAGKGGFSSASGGGGGGGLGGVLAGAQLPQGGGLQLSRQQEGQVREQEEFERRLRQIQLQRERVQNDLLQQQLKLGSREDTRAQAESDTASGFAVSADRREQAKLQQLIRAINSLV